MITTRREFLATTAAVVVAGTLSANETRESPIVVVVTDPLSSELSCPCVEGYAQRDYQAFGKWLSGKLGRPVEVYCSESLAGALTKKSGGRADLIIGKDSMIRAQAKENNLELTKLAALTGKDGDTTQQGFLVVHSSDSAISADQLKGYRILFGPPAAEEKHDAVKALLKDLNISYTAEPKDAVSCSECATKLLDHGKRGEKVAGVISSYAVPLLEGCGTVKKGDLRVIGKTDPVPFISLFVVNRVPAEEQKKIRAALLDMVKDSALCKVLETKHGFVEPEPAKKK